MTKDNPMKFKNMCSELICIFTGSWFILKYVLYFIFNYFHEFMLQWKKEVHILYKINILEYFMLKLQRAFQLTLNIYWFKNIDTID